MWLAVERAAYCPNCDVLYDREWTQFWDVPSRACPRCGGAAAVPLEAWIGSLIERKAEACAGAGAFAEIATVAANVTTYTDSAVTEGVTYCYRVAAQNAAGKSAYSNTAGRLVPPTVPSAPSALGVAGGP